MIMVNINQLLERADEWLKEKGAGLLNPDEIVCILNKIANILSLGKISSINNLERSLAICTGIALCKLRGYKVPTIVRWRGEVINTEKEEW